MRFKIADLVAVNMETLKAKDDVFDVEYVDTGSVTAGVFGPAEYFESLQQAPSRARRVAMAGDTVYSTVRPNQRHFGFITDELANRVYSTGFAVLHPNPEKVLPYYFYLIMNQEWVTETLHSIGSGSTSAYPSIKPGDILNLEVEVPTLEKQRLIVNIFQSLDGKMLINNQINDNLVALAGTIWRNFDVYESKEVRDLFDVKYGKTMPKTQLTSTGVPVFGANGMIGYTDKPVMLPDYSVVITSRGSGSGDVQLMDKGVFVTNNLLTIESKHPQSNWATWQMLEQANIQGAVTGSAQPQLTIENFARVVVNIPDKDTIQKFNEVSENFEQIYWANKNEIKLLTETRDTLLRKLIG